METTSQTGELQPSPPKPKPRPRSLVSPTSSPEKSAPKPVPRRRSSTTSVTATPEPSESRDTSPVKKKPKPATKPKPVAGAKEIPEEKLEQRHKTVSLPISHDDKEKELELERHSELDNKVVRKAVTSGYGVDDNLRRPRVPVKRVGYAEAKRLRQEKEEEMQANLEKARIEKEKENGDGGDEGATTPNPAPEQQPVPVEHESPSKKQILSWDTLTDLTDMNLRKTLGLRGDQFLSYQSFFIHTSWQQGNESQAQFLSKAKGITLNDLGELIEKVAGTPINLQNEKGLHRNHFMTVLKLIALRQSGKDASLSNLNTKTPLPQFDSKYFDTSTSPWFTSAASLDDAHEQILEAGEGSFIIFKESDDKYILTMNIDGVEKDIEIEVTTNADGSKEYTIGGFPFSSLDKLVAELHTPGFLQSLLGGGKVPESCLFPSPKLVEDFASEEKEDDEVDKAEDSPTKDTEEKVSEESVAVETKPEVKRAKSKEEIIAEEIEKAKLKIKQAFKVHNENLQDYLHFKLQEEMLQQNQKKKTIKYDKKKLKKFLAEVNPAATTYIVGTSTKTVTSKNSLFMSILEGQHISFLEVADLPIGLWVGKDVGGNIGFVRTQDFSVSPSDVKNIMAYAAGARDTKMKADDPNLHSRKRENLIKLAEGKAGDDKDETKSHDLALPTSPGGSEDRASAFEDLYATSSDEDE
eukprot:m.94491 g.94491  ORF g.94491 m.94491 type:complete len:694 (-) comp13448_c0_seq1:108-2189(-)